MASGNRSWMYPANGRQGRNTAEFLNGVASFIAAAPRDGRGYIKCPCRNCKNSRQQDEYDVGFHLNQKGFTPGYKVWFMHGEERQPEASTPSSSFPTASYEFPIEHNPYAQMVVDAMGEQGGNMQWGNDGYTTGWQQDQTHEEPNAEARRWMDMLSHGNQPLATNPNRTILQQVAEMMAGKNEYGISQKAFDYFLSLQLATMNPADAQRMPANFYETRRYLSSLRLPSIEIDVCENDCVLFYNEFLYNTHCPFCGLPRYVENPNPSGSQTIPRKKLWYFPLADRLKRLFLCPKTAANMTWHRSCSGQEDEMNHPACGEAWRHFDRCNPQFAAEDRNVYLGMSADGMCPFYNSASYSIWPVFMCVYNLPPGICMKQPFIFMSLIISGPRGPGKNIDVMLRPLIDELKMLFEHGVEAYDAHRKQNFTMRAALLWTVTDYPGYGMVSAWSTHGGLSCPYCMEHTSAFWLPHGRKFCFFDCHRKFLPRNHPYRRDIHSFLEGQSCRDHADERRSGPEMAQQVASLPPVIPGKTRKHHIPGFASTHNWNKQSIFWELPYWATNMVRHNLDVMHTEKNVFDNIFYTVMDDSKRTKDNLNARRDLQIFTNRESLFLQQDSRGKDHKPKATYTVTRQQKQLIFNWVHTLKFPDGYASNISKCFNRTTLGVSNMKSHDCHIFMQRLLTVAISDFLPKNIWGPISELSMFFRKLCAPRILRTEMEELQRTIVETLCRLERIFPPAFFDCMEHLPIHLPFEALVCGPVQYRWMYPFERRMHILKKHVKNTDRPEGCIAQAYLDSEVSNFCALYFGDDVEHRSNRLARNEVDLNSFEDAGLSVFQPVGRPLGKGRRRILENDDRQLAHLYILINCDEVQPFLSDFDNQMCQGLTEYEKQQARADKFPGWFQTEVTSGNYQVSQKLYALANFPIMQAVEYKGYLANGFRFKSLPPDKDFTTNCGVCILGVNGEDADPTNYYGILREVLVLNYSGSEVVMFRCHWFDNEPGVGTWTLPEAGLVEVNANRSLRGVNEPFILASQATQVYYALSPGNRNRPNTPQGRRNWLSVFTGRARHVIHGLTPGPQDEPTQNPRPEEVYQDDTTPNIITQLQTYDAAEQPPILATGEFERIEETVAHFPTEPPSTAQLFEADDNAVEYYSSDEYADIED